MYDLRAILKRFKFPISMITLQNFIHRLKS